MIPYLPHTPKGIEEMLEAIGIKSVEELFFSIPEAVRLKESLGLSRALSELELSAQVKSLSQKNSQLVSFLGAGFYDHFIPAVVDHLAKRSEFYTAYTPYQAEASQGILQAFFEYQSLICELTGMEVSNASLYDAGSALAEAAILARAATSTDATSTVASSRKTILVSRTVHPEYRKILSTYLGEGVKELTCLDGLLDLKDLKKNINEETAAVIVQHPNFFGCLEEVDEIEKVVHEKGALFIVSIDPISLGLLKIPGEYKADIVVGEGQSLGSPPYFGGATLGILASREKFIRRLPGRIVGETQDKDGRRGFVLTLQTREQHIRREKATSNICTNQALMALRAVIFLSTLGKEGLHQMAGLCLKKAHYLKDRLAGLRSIKPKFKNPFFKEFVVECSFSPQVLNKKLLKEGMAGGLSLEKFYPELKNCLLICCTEKRTREEIDRFVNCIKNLYG